VFKEIIMSREIIKNQEEKILKAALPLLNSITALSRQRGYCWASNACLAQNFNTTVRTVQNRLSKLKDAGYIIIDFDDYGKRRITPARASCGGHNFPVVRRDEKSSWRDERSSRGDENSSWGGENFSPILNLSNIYITTTTTSCSNLTQTENVQKDADPPKKTAAAEFIQNNNTELEDVIKSELNKRGLVLYRAFYPRAAVFMREHERLFINFAYPCH
jgi:hypothetical protein